MHSSRPRRLVTAALTSLAAGTALAAAVTPPAGAATIFRTVESHQAGLQLSAQSTRDGSPLRFVPRFPVVSDCATCEIPTMPPELTWAQINVVPNTSAVSLVNKKSGKCADVSPSAQAPGTSASGAAVVLAECDGTLSQQWKVSVTTNQKRFVNQLPGTEKLSLTDALGQAILEPITVNARQPLSEQAKHVQIFRSTFVGLQ